MSLIAKLRVQFNLDVILQKEEQAVLKASQIFKMTRWKILFVARGKHDGCCSLSLRLTFLNGALVNMQYAMLFVKEVVKGTLPKTNHRFLKIIT